MHILLIEDEQETAQFIQKGLQESGHVADHAPDGEKGLYLAQTGQYDVLIIDRMLPLLDGLSLIKTLRQQQIQTPALILSALGKVDHRVEGLAAGGDDYLVKPYAFSELLARLQALVRRVAPIQAQNILKVRDLEMNLMKHRVSRANTVINLQPREFVLLEQLLRNAGQVVTRTMLLEKVWDYHFDPQTNVIDVQISRLRRKIDRDFEVALLHTVRGAGYSLYDPETA